MVRLARMSMVIALAAICLASAGCEKKYDVIGLSNPSGYDFGLNDTPWTFQVWNTDPSQVAALAFTVSSSDAWLIRTPTSETSSGPDDRKVITVRVNRNGLSKGQHNATLTVSGDKIVSKNVAISVTSEGGQDSSGGWSLQNIGVNYTAPYLLEFDFSLRDESDHAVIAEPAQFQVVCQEDGTPISAETDVHLAKGDNKQLLTFLVLDYTLSMADPAINGDSNNDGKSDAIDKMEAAAKDNFLDAMDADAQVGIYEFHCGNKPPQKVSGFSVDKPYLKGLIDTIWTKYVSGFPAESRCWDALYAAVGEFSTDPEAKRDEQRAIVFLSDGRDESSTKTYNEVIAAAKDRGVTFYCIGFGAELDLTALQIITSQTGGKYYPAGTADELAAQFAQIINDLGGQYILRWATLKRTGEAFAPSFALTVSDHTIQYQPTEPYTPTEYAGDALQGLLRVATSESADKTTAYLRAAYVPRYITKFRLHAVSQNSFTVTAVAEADGGLCPTPPWTLTVVDAAQGGKQITLQTEHPDDIFTAIPFAAFGPILKFEFTTRVENIASLFTTLEIDDSIYSGGQTFKLDWPPH